MPHENDCGAPGQNSYLFLAALFQVLPLKANLAISERELSKAQAELAAAQMELDAKQVSDAGRLAHILARRSCLFRHHYLLMLRSLAGRQTRHGCVYASDEHHAP